MTPRILIVVPCKGSVCVNHYLFILELTKVLHREGIGWAICASVNGNVDEARNEGVREFLADPDFTHLWFIDGDVSTDPNIIVRFLAHKVGIICGVYPTRNLPAEYRCNIIDVPVAANGLLVSMGVPAGFMLIERWVLERLAKDFAHLTYERGEKKRIALFWHTLEDGRVYSEDMTFCRRATAAGILIHIDPTIEFTHQGDYLFKGKLNDILTPNGTTLSPTLRS